jgi:hypothetical protein
VKARAVPGLDPDGTLADNAERIVRVRLGELCSFMPRAADPEEVDALHDMRIAAKRLRYILELTAPCFGPYAEKSAKLAKDVQDLVGEIHDCDVQIPETEAFAARLLAEDAETLRAAAGDAPDLDPGLLARAPHAREHAGVAALLTHLHARRELLFGRFLALWDELERKGFRARLEFAVAERPGDVHISGRR